MSQFNKIYSQKSNLSLITFDACSTKTLLLSPHFICVCLNNWKVGWCSKFSKGSTNTIYSKIQPPSKLSWGLKVNISTHVVCFTFSYNLNWHAGYSQPLVLSNNQKKRHGFLVKLLLYITLSSFDQWFIWLTSNCKQLVFSWSNNLPLRIQWYEDEKDLPPGID